MNETGVGGESEREWEREREREREREKLQQQLLSNVNQISIVQCFSLKFNIQ